MAKDYAKVYRGENVMKRGIATYKDEAVFLSQDTLRRDMETLKGRPVVIKHQNVTPENMEEKAVGYVTETFYNNEAGTFGCKFVIFDDEAKELIRNGYSLSTCYKPTSFGAGGTEINTPYDREVTGLNFTHLALVPDPRYEDAKIYENGVMEMEEETLLNGGEGSGDFDHAGRPGEVGGSEPAGTGRGGKYTKSGGQNWVGAKPKQGKLFDEEDDKYTFDGKKYTGEELMEKGFMPIKYTGSIYKDDHLTYLEKQDNKKIYRVKISENEYKKLEAKRQKKNRPIDISDISNILSDKDKFEKLSENIYFDKNPNITGELRQRLYYLIKTKENLIKSEWDERLEKQLKKLKKQSEKQNAIIEEQERDNSMENEKMEIPVSFFDKVMDLICNSKKEKKNEEKEIEDVIDEKEDMEEEKENKCKKNEVVDKRDIIRQIMAIAGKKEASEDVKTIAKLAEKLAYDKDEAEKENAKEEVDEEYNNDEFFNALEIAKSLGEADKLPVPETQAKQLERGKKIFG